MWVTPKRFSVSFVLFQEAEALGAGVCTGTGQNIIPQCPSSTRGFSDVSDSSRAEKVSILLHVQGVALFGGTTCLLNRFPSMPRPAFFSFTVNSFTFCSPKCFLRNTWYQVDQSFSPSQVAATHFRPLREKVRCLKFLACNMF